MTQILLHAHDSWVRRRPFKHYASYEAPLRRYELKAPNLRQNLCSLRLVSRVLCQVATPLLFRHVIISVDDGIDRLVSLSRSPLRHLVLRLELGTGSRYDYFEHDKGTEDKCLAYMTRLAIVIHSALPRFSEIQSLKFDFSDIPYGENWEQDTTDFFESMATALRRSQLEKLDEVHLWLPLAFDFGYFLDDQEATSYSTESLFKRLAYLDLRFQGSTDEGEGLEIRSHQPNEEYAKCMHQLLSLAPNVHTLWLEGDLILDHSAFSPSLRLKTANLESLYMHATALTAIIRQSMETLEKVVMRGVYLESGTWEEIMLAMSGLPLLVDLFIETCGYCNRTDVTSHCHRPVPGHTENGSSYDPTYDFIIETGRSGDIDALGNVLVRMHKNKCRLYGDSYGGADLEGGAQIGDNELGARLLKEYVRKRFGTEGSESEMSDSESEDGLIVLY